MHSVKWACCVFRGKPVVKLCVSTRAWRLFSHLNLNSFLVTAYSEIFHCWQNIFAIQPFSYITPKSKKTWNIEDNGGPWTICGRLQFPFAVFWCTIPSCASNPCLTSPRISLGLWREIWGAGLPGQLRELERKETMELMVLLSTPNTLSPATTPLSAFFSDSPILVMLNAHSIFL